MVPAAGTEPAVCNGQMWVCSCGTTAVEVVEHLLAHGVPIAVLESVPHLEIATANLHARLHDSHGLIWWRKAG